MSRPDIANAVRSVARHSQYPTARHWKGVLRITEHLIGTKHVDLTFERASGLILSAFTDGGHAEKADHRRSMSGLRLLSET